MKLSKQEYEELLSLYNEAMNKVEQSKIEVFEYANCKFKVELIEKGLIQTTVKKDGSEEEYINFMNADREDKEVVFNQAIVDYLERDEVDEY